jgi:hypothetical protein
MECFIHGACVPGHIMAAGTIKKIGIIQDGMSYSRRLRARAHYGCRYHLVSFKMDCFIQGTLWLSVPFGIIQDGLFYSWRLRARADYGCRYHLVSFKMDCFIHAACVPGHIMAAGTIWYHSRWIVLFMAPACKGTLWLPVPFGIIQDVLFYSWRLRARAHYGCRYHLVSFRMDCFIHGACVPGHIMAAGTIWYHSRCIVLFMAPVCQGTLWLPVPFKGSTTRYVSSSSSLNSDLRAE